MLVSQVKQEHSVVCCIECVAEKEQEAHLPPVPKNDKLGASVRSAIERDLQLARRLRGVATIRMQSQKGRTMTPYIARDQWRSQPRRLRTASKRRQSLRNEQLP